MNTWTASLCPLIRIARWNKKYGLLEIFTGQIRPAECLQIATAFRTFFMKFKIAHHTIIICALLAAIIDFNGQIIAALVAPAFILRYMKSSRASNY